MRWQPITFALLVMLGTGLATAKEPDDSVEQMRAEIAAALGKFDPDPKKKADAEERLRTDLVNIVDKYSDQLRPATGSKKFVSADKAFVLVIAANDRGGAAAEAEDADAKIVVAVGGDGFPSIRGLQAGGGGAAKAKAGKGIAVAIGGRGGMGTASMGGGGGGSDATGDNGSVGVGGDGGGTAANPGGAGGVKIDNPEAVSKAAKELPKKS